MKFGSKSIMVKAFGFKKIEDKKNNPMLEQIKVLYYNDRNDDKSDFIIKLITKSSDDVCIISTLTPENTLLETYTNINKNINEDNKFPNEAIDSLIIPKINFKIHHSFIELHSKKLKNKKFNSYFIADSLQCIDFKFNEKGARIDSFTRMRLAKSVKHYFEIKGPFTIFIKDKNSIYPYFMAYFGNDELLERKQSFIELLTKIF